MTCRDRHGASAGARGLARVAALLLAGLIWLPLAGCNEEATAEAPPPEELTTDAEGYFCGMAVAEHPGPKGQIHLAGRAAPLWFPAVRDALAFTLLPEESRDILAIYVNDMGRAGDWRQPAPGSWINARSAWYVLGSQRLSGMGIAETVPFGEERAARDFAAKHGGRVMRFDDIPVDYVLGSADAGELL